MHVLAWLKNRNFSIDEKLLGDSGAVLELRNYNYMHCIDRLCQYSHYVRFILFIAQWLNRRFGLFQILRIERRFVILIQKNINIFNAKPAEQRAGSGQIYYLEFYLISNFNKLKWCSWIAHFLRFFPLPSYRCGRSWKSNFMRNVWAKISQWSSWLSGYKLYSAKGNECLGNLKSVENLFKYWIGHYMNRISQCQSSCKKTHFPGRKSNTNNALCIKKSNTVQACRMQV